MPRRKFNKELQHVRRFAIECEDLLVSEGAVKHNPNRLSYSLRPRTIRSIINRLVRDRFKLAVSLYRFLRRQRDLGPDDVKRAIVSKAYYAMFHAARAVVLHCEQEDVGSVGNIHNAISGKMKKLDFSGTTSFDFEEKLLTWRQLRNKADYHIYLNDQEMLRAVILAPTVCRDFLKECSRVLGVRGIKVRL